MTEFVFSSLGQRIRFVEGFGGVRIAYSAIGSGAPIVVVGGFHSHLELDLESPVWRPWFEELSRGHSLVRMDTRGTGLSDRDVADHSLEARVADLEAVIEALGLKRFTFLTLVAGAPTAITYAQRHPDRVQQLVMHGPWVRGRFRRGISPQYTEVLENLIRQVELGWDWDDPLVRTIFTCSFIPDATPEQEDWWNNTARFSITPADAARRLRASYEIDVQELAMRITCPSLILQPRDDGSYEEGRLVATLIRGSRFVSFDTRNHVLLAQEPSWKRWVREVHTFLDRPSMDAPGFGELTPREADLLALIARGMDNAQIAAQLSISEKTVRNHITNIFAKLKVESRAQAIVLSQAAGVGQTFQ